jgi:hypothetical protein
VSQIDNLLAGLIGGVVGAAATLGTAWIGFRSQRKTADADRANLNIHLDAERANLNTQLDAQRTALVTQLDAQRTALVTQLDAQRDMLNTQINANRERDADSLRKAAYQDLIRGIIDSELQVLRGLNLWSQGRNSRQDDSDLVSGVLGFRSALLRNIAFIDSELRERLFEGLKYIAECAALSAEPAGTAEQFRRTRDELQNYLSWLRWCIVKDLGREKLPPNCIPSKANRPYTRDEPVWDAPKRPPSSELW